MKNILLLALPFLLLACAAREDATSQQMPDSSVCPHALVVLPDNYVIDLAAGATVELNPAYQQFALFCSKKDAEEALAADIAAGRFATKSQWRVYRVQGDFAQLARPCGSGQFCLGVPAVLEDWVD